jgi:hypothetical protein
MTTDSSRESAESASQRSDTGAVAESSYCQRESSDYAPNSPCVSSRLIYQPDIRVLISGLQVLCIRKDYSELKVLKAPNHEFRIFVEKFCRTDGRLVSRETFSDLTYKYISLSTQTEWKTGRPTPYCPPTDGPAPDCLPKDYPTTGCSSNKARNPDHASWITKYQVNPFDNDILEREAFESPTDGSIVGSDDPKDFRWLPDLTSKHFYGITPLGFPDDAICPQFYLSRGQFYTAARTAEAYDRVTVRRRGSSRLDIYEPSGGERHYIGRIALVTGVNICVTKNDAALTIWSSPPNQEGHAKQSWDLVCFDTCQYYYKVAVTNLHPPFYDTSGETSDFPEYGVALNLPVKKQDLDVYDLQPTSRAVGQGSPCGPVGG